MVRDASFTVQITPPTSKCAIIRENAVQMFGTTCFKYKNKQTFRSKAGHKKHDLVSWILTQSGVSDPFAR